MRLLAPASVSTPPSNCVCAAEKPVFAICAETWSAASIAATVQSLILSMLKATPASAASFLSELYTPSNLQFRPPKFPFWRSADSPSFSCPCVSSLAALRA